MSKGKKIALIVTMAVVLVAAAVLNVTLLAGGNSQQEDTVQTGFFATSRADRMGPQQRGREPGLSPAGW